MIWLFSGFLAAVVIFHMARPRFLRREISAARFFSQLPQPKQSRSRLRLGRPRLSVLFLLRLLIVLLCLTAIWLSQVGFGGSEKQVLGVWFIVDTSASMTTLQPGKENSNRMDRARREVEIMAEKTRKIAEEYNCPACYRLSALDMERRDLLTTSDARHFIQVAGSLQPRPLGTDLTELRRLVERLNTTPSSGDKGAKCPVTHLVVFSDMPAPAWLPRSEGGSKRGSKGSKGLTVIWRDIGVPIDNVGLTAVRPLRNPLTGLVREVQVSAAFYGLPPANTRLRVIGPDGAAVMEKSLQWRADNTWHGNFKPGGPGEYRLFLSPGAAYGYDDTAVIRVGDERTIRVDWRLSDRRWLKRLGWSPDSQSPHLVVTGQIPGTVSPGTANTAARAMPTLVIGKGYGRPVGGRAKNPGSMEGEEIRDFVEKNPLIADLNFDAVESLGLEGIDLPAGFTPVLRGMKGKVWLALREAPLCACIPGFPTGTDDVLGRFSAVVFFNGLGWLLKERSLAPLYTLTSPAHPQPSGTRLALHDDEGNTAREPHSVGGLAGIKPVTGREGDRPYWPLVIGLAALFFLVERVTAVWRPREEA